MSKSDLQQLYENERQELENLKVRLDYALDKKQTTESLFKEIKQKLEDINENIDSIENDKEELISKYDFIITLFVTVLLLASILLMIFLTLGGPIAISMFIWNVLKMTIFNNIAGILTFVGSIGGYYISLGFFYKKIMPKIFDYLCEKIDTYFSDKIMNSTEYKELEFLLEASLELYEREEIEYTSYETEKKMTSVNYSAIKEQYDTKKGIVQYLDRQINPVETTLNLNKSLNQRERKRLKVNMKL